MRRITSKIRNVFLSTPFIAAIIILISYGLVVPFLGFFMDDWYIIWYKQLFGGWQFPAYFSIDRPLMGYFFSVASFLLGNSESAFVWQMFGLFTRWLVVVSLWGLLNTLWPSSKKQNSMIVLLAAVYPGFTQQWIAVVYSFFFTCLAGVFFSFTLMLKAIKEPKRFLLWYCLSFIIGVYSYAASEFYFGLELIRPLLIWIEYSRYTPLRRVCLKKTLITWTPFLIAFLGYGAWRGFFYNSEHHVVAITSMLSKSLPEFVIGAIHKTYQAIIDSVGNAWVFPFNLANYPLKGKLPWLILGLIAIVFLLIYWWFRKKPLNTTIDTVSRNQSPVIEGFCLAIVSLIVSVLPFLAADLPIDYQYPFDRFLLAYIFGSCLLITLLIDKKKIGIIVISLLIAISCGFQFTNGIRYKNSWNQQVDFFWQLYWRAPNLKTGTAIFTHDLPFSKYFSGPSLTAPLNMIYAPELDSQEIPYSLFLNIQQDDVITSWKPDENFSYDFRRFLFNGNTSNIIIIKKPADGCLRVFTQEDPTNEFYGKPDFGFWDSAIPLSNIDQIITESNESITMPEKFFGKEDRNHWCYFYEKADLAKQKGDWNIVIKIFAEADSKNYQPLLVEEWLPLVEANINNGDYAKAREVTKAITGFSENNVAGFCKVWRTAKIDAKDSLIADEMLTWLNCSAAID